MSKLFAVLLIVLEFPNYFDDPTKLFSDLYLAKFLDFSKIVSSVLVKTYFKLLTKIFSFYAQY